MNRGISGLLKRLSLRLRFVVNKIDSIGVTDGMDEEETRVYVADLVTEQLSGNGFRLLPEQVQNDPSSSSQPHFVIL